jgi:uncharacterized protein DUF6265
MVAYFAMVMVPVGAGGQPAPATQPATAQPASPAAPATPASSSTPAPSTTVSPSLGSLDWLRGCWAGKVGRREFTEQWQQARGGMMLGFSQMVIGDQTRDYTYLRIESRPDGLYYVAIPAGKKELAFKFAGIEDDKGVKVFTFSHSGEEFPQRIVYRQGEGLMFAQVGGKVSGTDKEVTYPMHRIDCVTGETPRS